MAYWFSKDRVNRQRHAVPGTVALESGRQVINFCANNYLGLSDNAELIEAGRAQTQFHGPFTLDH